MRIFHATGVDGIEGAGDAFRLISETWTFVESVFPYKVFTKYELALVSNCINLQVQGGYLKKNYMDLLEPFRKEMGENKAKTTAGDFRDFCSRRRDEQWQNLRVYGDSYQHCAI